MTAPTKINAVGVAAEAAYGDETSPIFYTDASAVSIDAPDNPHIIHPGGMTRFARDHQAGMYVPSGGLDLVVDMAEIYYFFKYLLGTNTFTDNTTSEAAEELLTTGAEETTGSGTADNTPIVPGTLVVEISAGEDVASDDGFGNLTEEGGSGVAGTVNYATGVITLTGLTAETQYDIDYDYGYFEHAITNAVAQTMLSLTLHVDKQQFMHTFIGCAIGSMTLTVEKELAMMSLDISAQKDKKEDLETLATVLAKYPQGYPVPFHQVTAKMVDYGGVLASISADVESLNLTINNNIDAESGVTIGSRYPARIWKGGQEITGTLKLVFDGTEEYEDFWGAATGPDDGPTQEKALQLFIDSNETIGDVTIDLYRCIFTSIKSSVSGRDRIVQEVGFSALFDTSETENIKVICNSIYNWDNDS